MKFLTLFFVGYIILNLKYDEPWVYGAAFFLLFAAFCAIFPAKTAHVLNTIFRLPHPGPNDIQGSCSCREHEGKNKFTERDYIKSFFS